MLVLALTCRHRLQKKKYKKEKCVQLVRVLWITKMWGVRRVNIITDLARCLWIGMFKVVRSSFEVFRNGLVLFHYHVSQYLKGYLFEMTYYKSLELPTDHIHIDINSIVFLPCSSLFLPNFTEWQAGSFALLQNASAQVCNWKAMTVIYFTSSAAALFWTILCHGTVQSTRPHIVVLKDADVTIWKFGVVISYKF